MFFSEVLEGQPDAIFGLTGAFQADVRPQKVNLTVGIYKDENLQSKLLPSVKKAEEQILEDDLLADYLPIDGFAPYLELLGPNILGEKIWKEAHSRIYGAHTTGGTGALRIAGEFLAQEVTKIVSIPNPTWPNHRAIFERAGCKVETYPYYNREKRIFDFSGMCKGLESLPEKSAVILHPCCHNPTGLDPTLEQWKELSALMKKRKLLPFFDFAYQGLGDSIEKDAAAIQLFAKEGHEMLIAYSCSKNFSLYCQRVGALYVVDENSAVKLRVGSQIKRIIRALYSNPPEYGAHVVTHILKHEELKKQWREDLEGMRLRLKSMRDLLIQRLKAKAKKIDFSYLKAHKGMFSFVDLNKSQVQKLINDYAIYLPDNGRINVAGLSLRNIDYIVDSLIAVCES